MLTRLTPLPFVRRQGILSPLALSHLAYLHTQKVHDRYQTALEGLACGYDLCDSGGLFQCDETGFFATTGGDRLS